MRRPWVHPLLLRLVASAAGAVLQAYASGWFAEISPSRIATLPVAILLGPWHGIVAVLLAALSGTIPPVLLALRVLEAAVVGAAARRGHSPLLAGGLFPLVIAALIGIAPQLYDVPAAGATNWARAMHLLLNRMVPVVVAFSITVPLASKPVAARPAPSRLRRWSMPKHCACWWPRTMS